MTDDPNFKSKPGPAPAGDANEPTGVNRLLSRFGPVKENPDRQSPGPRTAAGAVDRPTSHGHPASQSDPAAQRTATMDKPSSLFDEPADSVFGDVPVGAGTWTDPEAPPSHIAAITTPDDITIIPDAHVPPTVEIIDRRDWVRAPRRTGPVFRFLVIGFIAVLAIGTVYNRGNAWVQNQFDPEGDPGDPVEFEIAAGSTTNQVTQQLFGQGVISNPTLFRYWIGDNLEGDFQAGQYGCLAENMSFEEARDCLIGEGPVPPTFFSVTIPEGLRLAEIVNVLNAENPQFELADLQADLSATIVSVNLDGVPDGPIEGNPDPTGSGKEGLLFPATYQIDERDQGNTRAILARMAEQLDIEFEQAEAELGRDPVLDELELTDYEVLIVASLIEEEYGVEQDLGRISRVIYLSLIHI